MSVWAAGVPWGLSRVTDRVPGGEPGYATVSLDPETQTGVFRDGAGQVVEMGQHATPNRTRGTASVSGGSDGDKGAPQTQDDNVTDYESE